MKASWKLSSPRRWRGGGCAGGSAVAYRDREPPVPRRRYRRTPVARSWVRDSDTRAFPLLPELHTRAVTRRTRLRWHSCCRSPSARWSSRGSPAVPALWKRAVTCATVASVGPNCALNSCEEENGGIARFPACRYASSNASRRGRILQRQGHRHRKRFISQHGLGRAQVRGGGCGGARVGCAECGSG